MNQLEKQERNELLNNILEISDSEISYEEREFLQNSEIDGEIISSLLPLFGSNESIKWYGIFNEICVKKENPENWTEVIIDAFNNKVPSSVIISALDRCNSELELMQVIVSASESAAVSEGDFDDEPEEISPVNTDINYEVQKNVKTEAASGVAASKDFEVQAVETLMGYMDRQMSDEIPDLNKVEELISGAMHARDILKKYLERIKGLENMVVSQKQLLNQQMSQLNEQKEEIHILKASIDYYKEQLSEKTAKEQNVSSLLEQLSHLK